MIDEYHDYVVDLFRHKCIVCRKPSEVVHEIVPRSRRPKTWMLPENRVVLCAEHHTWVHTKGGKEAANMLLELRKQRLEEYERDND